MSAKYNVVCGVTGWLWKRIYIVIGVLLFVTLYFCYDWKVGYPKKNYHLVQYETFLKAKDYFLRHVEMEGTAEEWREFAQNQDLEYFQSKDDISNKLLSSRDYYWPAELQNYAVYKAAYDAQREGDTPVMWEQFLEARVKEVKALEAKMKGSNADRVAYKKAIRWDLPLPEELVKRAYEANYRLITYWSFMEAQQIFAEHQKRGWSAYHWELFASERDLAFPEDRSILPVNKQNEKWPAILSDYEKFYAVASDDIAAGVEVNKPYLWREYTDVSKLGDTPPDGYKERKSINEQLYFAIGCLVAWVGVILYALRIRGRFMAVDDEAYIHPSKKRIKYRDIYKVDKRKWKNKGLAILYYKDGSAEKKVRFDGLMYGGFDEEHGAPAERAFQTLMSHFKGEILDYEEEPEEEKRED